FVAGNVIRLSSQVTRVVTSAMRYVWRHAPGLVSGRSWAEVNAAGGPRSLTQVVAGRVLAISRVLITRMARPAKASTRGASSRAGCGSNGPPGSSISYAGRLK